MEWFFMVVRRYYHNGRIESKMIDRKNFVRTLYPDNQNLYRQEFYPCATLERAVKVLCNSVFPDKKETKVPYK